MSKTLLSPLLNEELIKSALQNYHNVNNTQAFQLKACDFKLSTANGENFCSEIYQVEVCYELNGNTEQKSFIIKLMIPEIAEIGSNEQVMFETVLPAMENLLKVKKDGEMENKLYAKCLISHRNKRDEYYVLENLNSLGYFCADRIKGLNLGHAEVVMRKIARFHAASMMFNKKFPEVVSNLNGSHFEKGATDAIAKAITFGGFEYVGNMIKNWCGYEILSEKVKEIIPKFNKWVMEVVNFKHSKFNVINHGDLWVNNFLYKYDQDSKPKDIVFVDFQNCFWGSCGFDINWFFNTSLELNVLKENRQQLIYTYYNELKLSLEKGNYAADEIPLLSDVLLEVQRCELIGLYCSLCEQPIVALDKSKCQGFDCNTFSQPEKMKDLRVLMYDNLRVKETLEYTLKYYQEINLL